MCEYYASDPKGSIPHPAPCGSFVIELSRWGRVAYEPALLLLLAASPRWTPRGRSRCDGGGVCLTAARVQRIAFFHCCRCYYYMQYYHLALLPHFLSAVCC